jgi:thioredoxin-like negative regulator of GroEL
MSGLPAAIAFAVALNLLMVTRFLFPQWMASGLVSMAFWTGVLAWGFYVARSFRELPLLIAPRTISDQPDRFPEARTAYLQGNWTEAERLLTGVLAIEPRDPPALLLLTGVYRHTERLEAAEVLLQEIAKLEVTDTWLIEVEAEALRLKRAIEASHKASRKPQENQEKTAASAADLTETRRRAA